MKAYSCFYSTILLIAAHAQAQPLNDDGTCVVSTILRPTMTISSCTGNSVQTYATTILEPCPTGLQPVTYTITETCTKAVCQVPSASAIPPGFTTAVVYCTACPQGRVTETITCPVESVSAYTNSGWANATPTPTGTQSGGSPESAKSVSNVANKSTGREVSTSGNPAPVIPATTSSSGSSGGTTAGIVSSSAGVGSNSGGSGNSESKAVTSSSSNGASMQGPAATSAANSGSAADHPGASSGSSAQSQASDNPNNGSSAGSPTTSGGSSSQSNASGSVDGGSSTGLPGAGNGGSQSQASGTNPGTSTQTGAGSNGTTSTSTTFTPVSYTGISSAVSVDRALAFVFGLVAVVCASL